MRRNAAWTACGGIYDRLIVPLVVRASRRGPESRAKGCLASDGSSQWVQVGLRRFCRPRTFHDGQIGATCWLPTGHHLTYRFVLLTTCFGWTRLRPDLPFVGCVSVSIQSQCGDRVEPVLSRVGQKNGFFRSPGALAAGMNTAQFVACGRSGRIGQGIYVV